MPIADAKTGALASTSFQDIRAPRSASTPDAPARSHAERSTRSIVAPEKPCPAKLAPLERHILQRRLVEVALAHPAVAEHDPLELREPQPDEVEAAVDEHDVRQVRLAELRARQAADPQLDPAADEGGSCWFAQSTFSTTTSTRSPSSTAVGSVVGEVGRIRRARGRLRCRDQDERFAGAQAAPSRGEPAPPAVGGSCMGEARYRTRGTTSEHLCWPAGSPGGWTPEPSRPDRRTGGAFPAGTISPGTRRRYSGRRVHAHQLLVLDDGPPQPGARAHRGCIAPTRSPSITPLPSAPGRRTRLARGQFLEAGLVADRVEVRIVVPGVGQELRRQVDRAAEVVDCLRRNLPICASQHARL